MFKQPRRESLDQASQTSQTSQAEILSYSDDLLVGLKLSFGGSVATVVCSLIAERGLTDEDLQSGRISIVGLIDEAHQLLHPTGAEDSRKQANVKLRSRIRIKPQDEISNSEEG